MKTISRMGVAERSLAYCLITTLRGTTSLIRRSKHPSPLWLRITNNGTRVAHFSPASYLPMNMCMHIVGGPALRGGHLTWLVRTVNRATVLPVNDSAVARRQRLSRANVGRGMPGAKGD